MLLEDMERTQERIDRIADYKIQRQQKDQERYDKEFREATEKIKGIAGKVGGVDGAEYLVRNYGLTGAEEQATKIQNLMEIYDVSPEFATKDENQTTINDLAKFSTAAPTITKVSLSLIHISEPTRRTPISYAVFCLKKNDLMRGRW